jgi:predicted enzyme related to lactoylglutathione lyase
MAGAVVYVKDLDRMRTFYERCFGLAPVQSADDFCVLASDDWDLSLVCVPAAVAAAMVITDPPGRREDSPLKLAFDVVSIEVARADVINAGGRVDPIESVWTFRGRRHLDCLDPEGNVVQVRSAE